MGFRPRSRIYNPKRRLVDEKTRNEKSAFHSKAGYGGNPEHKRNPGDFGLTPPSAPRPGKTLCDNAGVTTYREALRLLRKGMKAGLLSQRCGANTFWPQNIWSVTDTGIVLEAQLENAATGCYHGYPVPIEDPMRNEILEYWRQYHGREADLGLRDA